MKCIKKDGVIKRVTNRKAVVAVETDEWQYCPKSEWKDMVRDAKK